MFLFNRIKKFVVALYKGLIYWFFWASFVSMRDELFCSYTPKVAEDKFQVVNATLPPVSTNVPEAYDLLSLTQQDGYSHATQAIIDSFMAHMLSTLRVLANSAKDLPEKHRARLRFSSD